MGDFAVLDGKQGRAGTAVEDVDIAGLGDLRDGFDLPAVMGDGDEAGRGGKSRSQTS